jgi:hypothetical protein
MAIKYGSNEATNGYSVGNDANLGTNQTTDAVLTATRLIAVASSNDTTYLNGTVHDQAGTQLSISKALKFNPSTWRGAKITGSNATSVVSVSAADLMAIGSVVFENSGTGQTAVVIQGSSGADLSVYYTGTQFNNVGATEATNAQYTFNDTWVWGSIYLTDVVFSGYLKERGINSGNLTIAAARTKKVIINGCKFDNLTSSRSSGQVTGIWSQLNTASAGDWYFDCSGVSGKFIMPNTNAANLIGIYVVNGKTTGTVSITQSNFTIDSATTQTQRGIVIESQNLSYPIDAAVIANNKITSNASNGHIFSVGLNGVTNYVTNTKFQGNHAIGNSPSVATPHGITFGKGSTGTLSTGNISEKAYVGYLHDVSTSVTQQGDITKDCTGPHYYLKGCGNSTVQNCTALVSSAAVAHTVAKNAIVCITDQANTNTTTGNIVKNCTFICSDITKIGCLAAYDARYLDASNPQYGKFLNNVYIIPDTIDVTTTALFGYKQHETPNYTLAQWLTVNANAGETTVVGDRIIQLPRSEIEILIAQYYSRATGGGSVGGLIGGMTSPLIS